MPKHSHYFKPVGHLTHVDVYRVLALFGVVDPCLQHAVKKLLVAGGRGAGKDIRQDVQEAIDSLARWQEMREEDDVEPQGAPKAEAGLESIFRAIRSAQPSIAELAAHLNRFGSGSRFKEGGTVPPSGPLAPGTAPRRG